MAFLFTACELKTGNVIADNLPFEIGGSLNRGLQLDEDGTLSLPLLDAMGQMVDPDWEAHLLADRTFVAVTTSSRPDRIIGGWIITDVVTTLEPVVQFSCKTIDYYLVGRYVPTLNYTDKDQTSVIAKGLFQVAGGAVGIPLEYDCPASGVIRQRNYLDDANARVLDRLQELAAVDNGFNWTIDLEWADDTRRRVRMIARTGYPYLGNRDPNPANVFETPINVVDARLKVSGQPTHVKGIGDGEGESKIVSTPVIDTVREAALWPRKESRPSFSGVTDQTTIQNNTAAVAAGFFADSGVIELTTRAPSTAMGEDFTWLDDVSLGDTARVTVKSVAINRDEVSVLVGWSISGDNTFKPVLAKMGDA